MNKYIDAFDLLLGVQISVGSQFTLHKMEAKKLIKVLVDLHTPMKPYVSDERGNYVEIACENCDIMIQKSYVDEVEIKPSYCEHCGQALDWSE